MVNSSASFSLSMVTKSFFAEFFSLSKAPIAVSSCSFAICHFFCDRGFCKSSKASMVGPVWLLLDAAAAAVDCVALKSPIFQSCVVSCCFVSLESVIPLAVVCSKRSQLYLVAPVMSWTSKNSPFARPVWKSSSVYLNFPLNSVLTSFSASLLLQTWCMSPGTRGKCLMWTHEACWLHDTWHCKTVVRGNHTHETACTCKANQ